MQKTNPTLDTICRPTETTITLTKATCSTVYETVESIKTIRHVAETQQNKDAIEGQPKINDTKEYETLLTMAYNEVAQIHQILSLIAYPPHTKALVDKTPLASQVKNSLSIRVCHSPLHIMHVDDAIQNLFSKPQSIAKAVQDSHKSYPRLLSALVRFALNELRNMIYNMYQKREKFARFVNNQNKLVALQQEYEYTKCYNTKLAEHDDSSEE